jgi:PKD repeat protein
MFINQTWDPTYVSVSNIRVNTSAVNIPGLAITTSEIHNDKGFALINLSKPSGFTSPANALYDFNISFVNYAPNGTIAQFSFDDSSRYYDPVNATLWPFTYINGADAVLGAWPPVANFTGTPTSGTIPLTVSFTDSSTNYPTSWYWLFGDGNASTSQNPSNQYLASGIYDVDLRVTNAAGSAWLNRTAYINASQIIATSSGTPTSGQIPLTVNFTGSATGSGDFSYYWIFGDGNTSTSQNPSHIYSTEGIYDISLQVTELITGSVIWSNHTSYINASDSRPVANFTGTPTLGTVPLAVSFTDTSTLSPTSWNWSFGDGGTSTLQNPTHIYNSVGIYEVDLQAGNSFGTNWSNKTGYINVTSMVATSSGTPTTGATPLTVNFTGSSTGSPDAYYWDFGDGNTGATQNPSHTYETIGVYDISFRATNISSGAFAWANHTSYITVRNATPVASFTGTPTTGPFPLSVSFTDSSTNNPAAWNWSFGDGNTSTTQNPTHSYAAEGTYTVSLTVSNDGGTNTSIRNNYITVTAVTPVANFTGTPTTGAFPLAVSFTDTSTNSPTSWNWTFGDGVTAMVKDPNHTYTTAGTYTVSLTSANTGGSNTVTKPNYITVTAVTPVANFTASPSSGTFPLAVSFTDTTTNAPTSWSWNFGDGNTSTLQNPNHTYTGAGNFTVTLTATNTGGSNSTTRYVVVNTPSGAVRQDLAMAPYYSLVLSIANANTGAIIPVVTVVDSYGNSVNTTTGAFTGTYPYGPVSLTLTADGYYSQTVSYVMTADATYAITLTPVSSQSQNTNIIYTQQQVRFIVMNSEGTKVNGALISASVVNSTLPSDSLTILEQAFGINANVAEIMLNGAEVMSGTTAGDGSLTFMMFPSLTYNLTITGVPAAPWYISVSPRETEYTIHQPTANATSSYSNYVNTNITITEPNASYITFNAVFQDLSGATTNVKYYVVYRPNNTIIYYRDMGNPGKSAVTDNSVTVPNIRGVTYWAYFNKTTV